ncbi:MAG TPA: PVC-type heme-binding CxxCH protein, partial [Chthoniobacteraceae bacterium]|nr:PVC-type heme-binding CxxCH protein [Chthoniobacteraceae bacterium]
KQVFYEGLDLVTGLVLYKDGVIVTQAPDILRLRDTDGDGKADKVEKLYTGLGTNDTHAVINNPRWGWDGWIYATHGYSASNNVRNAKGERMGNIGSGVVRFLPDGSKIEQYSSKGGNTWGLEITGDNRVMWTQPTSGQLLMQTVLPEYALARGKVGNTPSFKVVEPSPKSFPLMTWEQLAYVQIDWVGSFTAAAGTVIYDGGAWPAEYNGDYFTTEPTINVIHHTRLTPDGSSYKASKLPGREQTEFVRSKDMWWRPIEVRVSPDGAMFVSDFYNQAVIHNDTRGPDHNRVNAAVRPDRDHYFGRIWRLDHKQTKKLTVPDLSKAGPDELITQLGHPNRDIRMTASRLLVERAETLPADQQNNFRLNFAQNTRTSWQKMSPEARVAAMWTLYRVGATGQELPLDRLAADNDPLVRRNAALIVEAQFIAAAAGDKAPAPTPAVTAALTKALLDSDGQIRVAALRALAAGPVSDEAAKAIVASWPQLEDDFQRSAAVGAAAQNAAASIAAALDQPNSQTLAPLVVRLAQAVGEKNDSAAAAKLVVSLAAKPAGADPLKRTILDAIGKSLKDAPAMTPELSSALSRLLASGASGSALPLTAKWDKAGTLKNEVTRLTSGMIAALNNKTAADDARFAAATSLLGLRSANAGALPAVMKLLASDASPALQKWIVVALGETNDPTVGPALSTVFSKLPAEVQTAAFDVVLKRADWALAFLDAVKAKQVDPTALGPASAFRLRTHPDKAVAQRATAMLDELNPMAKAKNEAIAKLTPVIEQPGNVGNGKQLFTTTCAVCHKFGELGADIGPGLTGMGSHGPTELLTAIVDPNREVDPSFVTWNIETKDGQSYAGVIAAENPTSITLKSLAGVQEIKTANVKTRVNTGRSLMPEGFEGLNGEMLRDIIAYMQSVDGGKFRTLDLSKAFTANTAHGLYVSAAQTRDTLKFAKTGNVTIEGIPFNIVAPGRGPANVIVLRGGPDNSFAKQMPERVDVPVGGFKANRLHFLGG